MRKSYSILFFMIISLNIFAEYPDTYLGISVTNFEHPDYSEVAHTFWSHDKIRSITKTYKNIHHVPEWIVKKDTLLTSPDYEVSSSPFSSLKSFDRIIFVHGIAFLAQTYISNEQLVHIAKLFTRTFLPSKGSRNIELSKKMVKHNIAFLLVPEDHLPYIHIPIEAAKMEPCCEFITIPITSHSHDMLNEQVLPKLAEGIIKCELLEIHSKHAFTKIPGAEDYRPCSIVPLEPVLTTLFGENTLREISQCYQYDSEWPKNLDYYAWIFSETWRLSEELTPAHSVEFVNSINSSRVRGVVKYILRHSAFNIYARWRYPSPHDMEKHCPHMISYMRDKLKLPKLQH